MSNAAKPKNSFLFNVKNEVMLTKAPSQRARRFHFRMIPR